MRVAPLLVPLLCVAGCYGRSAVTEVEPVVGACAAFRAGLTVAGGGSALLGHWPFDAAVANETSAARVVDLAPLGNHGTLVTGDGAADKSVAGVAGRALAFDGADDYVELPHRDAYLVDAGTVMFWLRTPEPDRVQVPFSKDALGQVTGGHLSVLFNNNEATGTPEPVVVRLQDATGTTTGFVVGHAVLPADVWVHVAVTFGPTGLRLFLEGTLIDEDPYAGGLGLSSGGAGNHEPIAVGANTWTSASGSVQPISHPFLGSIDEVSLWARDLGADEVETTLGCDLGRPPGG